MASNASPKQAEAEARLAAAEGEGHELTDEELAGVTAGTLGTLGAAISKAFVTKVDAPRTPSEPAVSTPVSDPSTTFQKQH
jgi:hypothetical protein